MAARPEDRRVDDPMSRPRFHQFAWGLLAYNLAVILGGAFVRATRSGDGCGQNWPHCNGQWIPSSGRVGEMIEYAHRASSGLLLPLVVVLLIWALRAFPKRHPVRIGALCAFCLTLAEGAVGAGLVLYKLVAHDQSVSRAIVMPTHLVLTFLLLMSLTLTAWWASGGGRSAAGRTPRLRDQGSLSWVMGLGLLVTIALGISGAITALGDTLFPARTLQEGLQQKFSPTAHFLLGLRIYHPIIALSAGFYLTLVAGMAMEMRPAPTVRRFARATVALFLIQMAAGLVNLTLLAPVWMQLVHLLIADLFWISLVLLTAATLAEEPVVVGSVSKGERGIGGSYAGVPASATSKARLRDYIALTKPRVISLLLFTTVTAMAIAAGGSGGPGPGAGLYLAVALGFTMAAGAANAINMVLERDLDLAMGRTATRPTVTQRIAPQAALGFALALMVGSFGLLAWSANLLSAALAQAGLLFYVVIYTLLLKRRTWTNIVIGGAAGAFPPLVGWAAVTGSLSPLAWILFGIVFLWTPVHFWALAILLKEDYARAGVPMLPVVRGERATVFQIACYAVLTVAISAMPVVLRGANGQAAVGGFYLAAAALLNAVLLVQSFQLYRHPDRPKARSLFKYSMVYLALLFLAMAVDRGPWI
jgi:protoheme IX farnesyltransferase